MISLLRKVRKGVSTETGVNKYIFYAIGEIILVMIGILLALEVNNWNQDRQNRKKEIEILRDLQVEFLANQEDANRISEGHKATVIAMSKLQECIGTGTADRHLVDSLMYMMMDWFSFTPKPGASDNLISAGNLDLITNRDLRYHLTLWRGVVADLTDDEMVAIEQNRTIIMPYMSKNYPLPHLEKFEVPVYRTLKEKALTQYNWSDGQLPLDLPALFKSSEILNMVTLKKLNANHCYLESQAVVRFVNTILDIIAAELENVDT